MAEKTEGEGKPMVELGRIHTVHTNVRVCISSALMAFAQLMHELLLLINSCSPFNRQNVSFAGLQSILIPVIK